MSDDTDAVDKAALAKMTPEALGSIYTALLDDPRHRMSAMTVLHLLDLLRKEQSKVQYWKEKAEGIIPAWGKHP